MLAVFLRVFLTKEEKRCGEEKGRWPRRAQILTGGTVVYLRVSGEWRGIKGKQWGNKQKELSRPCRAKSSCWRRRRDLNPRAGF